MLADEAKRVRAGASRTATIKELRRLAKDPSPTVRAAIALNPQAPAAADLLLVRDTDERVRILVARKLAALVPTLSGGVRMVLREQACDMLAMLAEDTAERVRQAIAEELKDMPDAPHALILQLARDRSVMVCEPVILFSPMLTETDLVALVTLEPAHPAVAVVARRPALASSVADAIAETANHAAIRALLSNHSAQIREATLDVLAARSAGHADWQEPLVRRPALSPKATQALSEVVTTHLLGVLSRRADLDPKVARALQTRLVARFAQLAAVQPAPVQEAPVQEAPVQAAPVQAAPVQVAGVQVAGVQAAGVQVAGGQAWGAALPGASTPPKATEDALIDAVRRGSVHLATTTLATAAAVPVAMVERASALRSAKGLVSLVWKAGFTMRAAVAVQALLARLPPDAMLYPGPAGEFPLGVSEMRWQIEFIARAAP